MVNITPSMLVSLSRMPPLISSHDTVSCYHLTCFPVNCSKQVFIIIPQLSQSFVSPVTTRNMKHKKKHVAGITFSISAYLQKTMKLRRENNIWYIYILYFFHGVYVKKHEQIITFCLFDVLHAWTVHVTPSQWDL